MQNLSLESFEADALASEQPDEAFENGFSEGFEAGLAAANSAQETLAQELVQAIADLEFNYDEARGEITRATGPLLRALAHKIFPHLVGTGFADQIVAVLHQATISEPQSSFILRVHPDQHGLVAAAVSSASLNVDLTADPSLQPHAAWAQSHAGALHIDCDRILEDIRSVLSSIDFIETGKEIHGTST